MSMKPRKPFGAHNFKTRTLKHPMSIANRILQTLGALMVVAMFQELMTTSGFTIELQRKNVRLTSLNAWTLPKPSKNPLDTFTSSSFRTTWYDDHHPTARKVIYNDDDHAEPFRFVLSFNTDDWISSPPTEIPTKELKQRRSFRHFANGVYKRWRHHM